MKSPLKNLMNTTIETIVEAIEQKPWFAYINNSVAFTGVAINHKQLYEEIQKIQGNPELLEQMEKEAIDKFGKRLDLQVASIIFKHVWAMVVYNTSSVIAIDKELKEFKQNQVNKLA